MKTILILSCIFCINICVYGNEPGAGNSKEIKTDKIHEKELITKTKSLLNYYIKYWKHEKTHIIYNHPVNLEKRGKFAEPADTEKNMVNGKIVPYGYGSGFSDTSLYTGHLLFGVVDAYEARKDAELGEIAKELFIGMKTIGTSSPVPGFIPRGPHPDDLSAYYRDSSIDQHTSYIMALYKYYKSSLASEEEKEFIRDSLNKFGKRLEDNKWKILIEDNSREAHAGGAWTEYSSEAGSALLSVLGILSEVVKNDHWKTRYEKYSMEDDGKRWQVLVPVDNPERLGNILYVNQIAFRLNVLYQAVNKDEHKKIISQAIKKWAEIQLNRKFPAGSDLENLKSKIPDKNLIELGWKSYQFDNMFEAWKHFNPEVQKTGSTSWVKVYNQNNCVRVPLTGFSMALLGKDADLKNKISPLAWEMLNKVNYELLVGTSGPGEIVLYLTFISLELYADYFSNIK